MERGIQNVYILGEDEELIVRAKESFKDGEKERKPGDQWMIRGPGEYVLPVEVEVVLKRKANLLDEDDVIYVRDFKRRRTVSGTPFTQATLRQRAPLTMQEIGAGDIVGPVRAQLQTSTTTVATGLNPVQLAQRTSAANTGVQQQQLQQATKTALTQQQFQILHNPNIFKQMQSQQQQQQQAVIPLTLPGQLKTATGTTRPLAQEDLARPRQQQMNQQKVVTGQAVVGSSVAQLQAGQVRMLKTPQIIAATQLLPVIPATQTVPTLVKTVSAPTSVTIPSNVSINLNLQQKRSVDPTQKVNATPMLNAVQIIQQQGGRSLTVHQLNQLIKQHPQGLNQIIATVTQSQAQPQITKVISTAGNIQTSHMQTIPESATTISGIVTSATSGSPAVTLSQLPSLNSSSTGPGQSSVTASIVKPGSITTQDGVTTVQIHPDELQPDCIPNDPDSDTHSCRPARTGVDPGCGDICDHRTDDQ